MILSCTVCEINSDFSRKSQIFLTPEHFAPPADGVPLGIRMMGLADGQNSFKIRLAV